ncbi:MAG: cellulose biosynthesis cyclic di-GMP-binding regulatory protein BcsB [Ardenticatenaceae bacterium]
MSQHKIILTGCTLFLLGLFLFLGMKPSYAQTLDASPTASKTPLPSPTASKTPKPSTALSFEQSLEGPIDVTFAEINKSTFELHSPFDQRSFSVGVPYRWVISGDSSYLEIHYSYFEIYEEIRRDVNNATTMTGQEVNDAIVNVYFNDVIASTFMPAKGLNQMLRIPIPPAAVAVSDPKQTRHKIRFSFLSEDCDEHQRRIFTVHDHSFIHFEYDRDPLEINLGEFPYPVAQNFFTPESILLIIPDEYSDADLEAATSVAASIGQRVSSKVELDIITAAEAGPERLANASAIIIGQPADNAFLLDLYERRRLPTTLDDESSMIIGRANQPILADDGVLQEILSDFSDDHVYLIVTGNSDMAVRRAAQTLSALEPRYGLDGDLVVVSELYETLSETPHFTDTLTLSHLGFEDTTFYGIGNQADYDLDFFVPSNWQFTDDPTLTLVYFDSALLASDESALSIELNNEPVSSIAIDQTSLGEHQAVIKFSPADFKPGVENTLTFKITMHPRRTEHCGGFSEEDLAWIRISRASQLHLPHIETEEIENILPLLKKETFLTTFAARQDLSNIWFTLPEKPSQEELAGMIDIVRMFGGESDRLAFAPRVTHGTITDTSQLAPYHLIAFGQPTQNSIIPLVNDELPQPFVPDEDRLRQEVGHVVYRLPKDFSLGVAEILPSPWNVRRAIAIVSGTTQEGVGWAINALTDDKLSYSLEGDLAFVRDDRIETLYSTERLRGAKVAAVETVAEVESEAEEVTRTTAASISATPTIVPKDYGPPQSEVSETITQQVFGLIGSGLLIAVVGGFFTLRKSRTKR